MSALVETLLWQIRAAKLPAPVQELRFAPPRRWRFDLAWEPQKIAVEVQGAIWTHGKHSRGPGQINDMDKLNAAQMGGWKVYQFANTHIKDGTALRTIEAALEGSR